MFDASVIVWPMFVFPALIVAAIEDVEKGKIRNMLSVLVFLLGGLATVWLGPPFPWAEKLLSLALLVPLIGLWKIKKFGAGDVKMSAAIMLTIQSGFYGASLFFLTTFVLSGVYVPAYIIVCRPSMADLLRYRFRLVPILFVAALCTIGLIGVEALFVGL